MKNKWSRLIVGFVSLFAVVPMVHSQAAYTAERKTRIQAGVGALGLNPDYTTGSVIGLSAWADYDFAKHLGVEVSTHFQEFITPGDIAENSYLLGPRFIYRRKGLTAYAKALVGRATITNLNYSLSSSYNVYAFGGGLEYRIAHKFNLRVIDFEQQEWPDFQPHTLAPAAATFGLSYIIH